MNDKPNNLIKIRGKKLFVINGLDEIKTCDMTAKMNPINHGSKLTPEQNLTKKIYEFMQLPYLSERHDAIKSLIEAEVEKAKQSSYLDGLEAGIEMTMKRYNIPQTIIKVREN